MTFVIVIIVAVIVPVIDSAKDSGLYETSVIVYWGDHGYQLGENNQWSKVDFYVSEEGFGYGG